MKENNIKFRSLVAKLLDITPIEALVAEYVSMNGVDNDLTFEAIGDFFSISAKTVQRSINHLVGEGVLEKVGRSVVSLPSWKSAIEQTQGQIVQLGELSDKSSGQIVQLGELSDKSSGQIVQLGELSSKNELDLSNKEALLREMFDQYDELPSISRESFGKAKESTTNFLKETKEEKEGKEERKEKKKRTKRKKEKKEEKQEKEEKKEKYLDNVRTSVRESLFSSFDDLDNGKPVSKEEQKRRDVEDLIDRVLWMMIDVTKKQRRPQIVKSSANRRFVRARISEGATFEDFERCVRAKSGQWLKNPKMKRYLQPKTIFSPSKFWGYVDEGSDIDTLDVEYLIPFRMAFEAAAFDVDVVVSWGEGDFADEWLSLNAVASMCEELAGMKTEQGYSMTGLQMWNIILTFGFKSVESKFQTGKIERVYTLFEIYQRKATNRTNEIKGTSNTKQKLNEYRENDRFRSPVESRLDKYDF